jgi:NAD(P)H dehydrogenase (quinone)
MILITGAAGHLGTAVITHLLRTVPASQLVALVRTEQKGAALAAQGVTLRLGDYNDPASLDQALRGVEKVLLISALSLDRLSGHQHVIDAAKRAGVQHLAYTGVTMQHEETSPLASIMQSHFQTEDYLRASGLAFTLLRNGLYAEVLPFCLGTQAVASGVTFPAGHGRVPYILRTELAEIAVKVLTEAGHANQTYQLTGPQALSFADVARLLAELSGQPVAYHDVDPVAFATQQQQAGMPPLLIQVRNGFAAAIKRGDFDTVYADAARLLGRPPTPVREYLQHVYLTGSPAPEAH